MTLRYLPLDVELPVEEGTVNVLSVEDPKVFSDMLIEFHKAVEGGSGNWMLADNDSEQRIAKNLDMLWNSLFVDLNEKKLLNALYKELEGFVTDSLFAEYSALNSSAISLIDKLAMLVPYPLSFDLEGNVTNLFKLYQVQFEDDAESPVERLTNYIRLSHQIKRVNGFAALNLKQFFTAEELHELYEFIEYEKVHLFILEGYHSKVLPKERNWIVDKDLCIIEL